MSIRDNLKKKRIGVLYGGWSAEREISILSGKAVINALERAGYNVLGIDVDRAFTDKIKKGGIDIAFIALHGTFGEDGGVQSLLEFFKIPYTGSGVLASAVAMNKIFSKQLFGWNRVLTPGWSKLSKKSYESAGLPGIRFPVIVKPASQGSAVGVNLVENRENLKKALTNAFRYDQEVIVEEYIEGRELTVGILGDKALPVVEIIPVKSKFYDYRAKYSKGGSRHIVPAQLSRKVTLSVQNEALKAFDCLGCDTYGRVDVMLDRRNKPYVLEVNTIPGMTDVSLLPDAAGKAGIDFTELVLRIIELSLNKRK